MSELRKNKTLNISQHQEQEKPTSCRYPIDALNRICNAFSDFGNMLKIEVHKPIKSISPEAQSAVIQSYFGDPKYLRGTLLFHRFMRPEEVDEAKDLTLPLARELYMTAKKINAARAKSNLLQIETAFQWLYDKSHLA